MSTSPPELLVPSIQGLSLRAFQIRDANRLARLAGVDSVVRFTLGIPLPYSVSAAREWIAGLAERHASGVELIFALSLDQALIGSVGLTLELEHRRAEIGYWLGEGYRGRGYARAAVECVCQYAFATLALRRVYALCFPENVTSHRLLEAAGFEREGLLRQHIVKETQSGDVICFARVMR